MGGGRGNVKIFDAVTGELKREHERDNWIKALEFNPDGTLLAAGGADRKVALYHAATLELRREIDRGACISAIAFSRDGSQLAVGDRSFLVAVHAVSTGELQFVLKLNDWVISLDFSPDSLTLAVGCGDYGGRGELVLVDLAGAWPGLRKKMGRAVRAAYSPDGATLAVGSWWGTKVLQSEVLLYDTAAGKVRLMRCRS